MVKLLGGGVETLLCRVERLGLHRIALACLFPMALGLVSGGLGLTAVAPNIAPGTFGEIVHLIENPATLGDAGGGGGTTGLNFSQTALVGCTERRGTAARSDAAFKLGLGRCEVGQRDLRPLPLECGSGTGERGFTCAQRLLRHREPITLGCDRLGGFTFRTDTRLDRAEALGGGRDLLGGLRRCLGVLSGFWGVEHAQRLLSPLNQLLCRGEGCRLIGDDPTEGSELAGSAG